MTIPYVSAPDFRVSIFTTYSMILLVGIACGIVAAGRLARRFGIPPAEIVWLALSLVVIALVGAHFYDVVFYQWDEAARDAGLWFHVLSGVSLFGALFATALYVVAWTRVRRLDLALHADVLGVGWCIAMAIGRVGCALVHDHPGLATDSPVGVDFPANHARMWGESSFGGTVRMHDVGLEELLLTVPLAIVGWVLLHRRLRAGLTAAILGIAYACVRFALDFLRLPMTEPTYGGLTAGQWSSLGLLVVASICAARIARVGHIAPLADELGGELGGRRRQALPHAATRA